MNDMLFYLPASGQVFYADQLQQNTGFSPDTDPAVLASNGIYTVNQTANPCDPYLYSSEANYTVVGNYADQSWTCTAYSLSTAQAGAEYQVKVRANDATSEIVASNYVSPEVLTSVAGQDLVDRPAPLQSILAEMEVVSNNLGDQIVAIAAATSVDEINNIVNKPTGVINIGRGQFGGPLDLNASNYVEFNSVSMTESETELYAPATASTVVYQGFPPDDFNSGGPIFTVGNYLIQIRETATGMVIAEFEVPLSLDGSNENISF